MESYNENYGKQLQKLLHAVTKSQKKYIEASEKIDVAELKNLFNRYAFDRNQIISELNQAILNFGGQISDSNDEIVSHHWNEDGNSPDSKKDQSIMEKLRSTERETLDAYDDVLQGTILENFNLKTLIMGHRLIINEAFTELDRRYFELFKLSQPY